jgi:hypothetical protein
MIRIDRTELFKSFIIFEAFLVGIPMVVIWSTVGVLCLAICLLLSDNLLGPADLMVVEFLVTPFSFVFSFYFFLPSLIASGLFREARFGVFPKGVAGWLFVVGTYSILALLFALTLSLRTQLRKQNKS